MKNIDKSSLVPLGHLDIIKEGDIVFSDFGDPDFRVGANHKRIGTEYDSFIDMPMYRQESKMMAKDFA
jgi:hypothetical protein